MVAKGLRERAYAVDVVGDGEAACYQAWATTPACSRRSSCSRSGSRRSARTTRSPAFPPASNLTKLKKLVTGQALLERVLRLDDALHASTAELLDDAVSRDRVADIRAAELYVHGVFVACVAPAREGVYSPPNSERSMP